MRTVKSLLWNASLGRWVMAVAKQVIDVAPHYIDKARFLSEHAAHAALMHRDHGVLSMIRVFGKDGKIKFERTYGKDPKRSKG